MSREELVLYLRLTPEFGGNRFGPYEGAEVRFGTDADRCHIALAEGMGILPDHCRVLRQATHSLILAPTERSATLWLWSRGARRPSQVRTATAIQPGDRFALATADGPCFVVELGPLPDDVLAARRKARFAGPRGLSMGRLGQEGRRRIFASLYTFSPVALAMKAMHYVQSGAIWNPRILIGGFLLMSGWIAGGGMSLTSCRYRAQRNQSQYEVEALTERAERCERRSCDPSVAPIEELIATGVGDPNLGAGLENDPKLARLVRQEAEAVSADIDRYRWIFRGGPEADDFAELRGAFEDAKGVPKEAGRLLAYGALTRSGPAAGWVATMDSLGEESCGRGPLAITWRQAYTLGLDPIQPDALVRDAGLLGPADLATLLQTRQAEVGLEPTPDMQVERFDLRQGASTCVYAAGDDARGVMVRLKSALKKRIGEDSRSLPDFDQPTGSLSRLASFYLADSPSAGAADFSSGPVSAAVEPFPEGDRVLERVARAVARAAVLPCHAVIDYPGEQNRMKQVFGELPSEGSCFFLGRRLTAG